MGISFTLKTKIVVNGKEYGSVEEMPAAEHGVCETALSTTGKSISVTCTTNKFLVNGKQYDSVEAMPPEIRSLYEHAIAVAKDSGGLGKTGLPPASPGVRSPLNPQVGNDSAGRTSWSGILWLIAAIVGLCIIIVAVIYGVLRPAQ
jgi:hypothetical protein